MNLICFDKPENCEFGKFQNRSGFGDGQMQRFGLARLAKDGRRTISPETNRGNLVRFPNNFQTSFFFHCYSTSARISERFEFNYNFGV